MVYRLMSIKIKGLLTLVDTVSNINSIQWMETKARLRICSCFLILRNYILVLLLKWWTTIF